MVGETILVTGAGGLVGYALTQELVTQGRRVVGLDLRNLDLVSPLFKPVNADLTDIHRLYRIFKSENITSVIHCGAISGPMLSLDNPYAICQVNIMGTANLLEASRVFGIQRFVYCSSGSAYGRTKAALVNEDTPLFPAEVYGATKASGEHLVQAFTDQHGLDGVSIRLCTVYGPRRVTFCIIRQMLIDALEGRPTVLNWGITSYRQFIYARDAALALIAALDKPNLPQTVYNVAGKSSYVTIGEAAQFVKKVIPSASIQVGREPEPNYIARGEFDVSAIQRDIGFLPIYDLPDGISVYLQWLEHDRKK